MSEVKKTFMEELDLWSEANVINPLLQSEGETDEYVDTETIEQVQKAIRTKVLQSFRNGLRAGAKPAPQPVRVREYQPQH